ncbi:branched-chain amino acid ABC transporter permease [Caldisericum sp.]|jgi:branched-chain amino acid transport system permease protein|uniref:branched-chain amino acid ABC transporter permease n=1 Tax=Caldisericum sp. TaxID=2499687 RepID=UPI003D125826
MSKSKIFRSKIFNISLFLMGLILCIILPKTKVLNPYITQVLIYIGINIIITVSLNIVNGYMGEFSLAHGGFMAIGAYISSILSISLLKSPWFFPLNMLIGGVVAAFAGFLVAIPSFKTRGDYFALITLGFSLVVKSLFENIQSLGGARGIAGIPRFTDLSWVYITVVLVLILTRNIIYSNFGRGLISIREDEIASELSSVNTKNLKTIAFVTSAFFTGIAGSLFAHTLMFINPSAFGITRITEGLVMVYLGGIGSITGSIIGATIWTILIEALRGLGIWKWVIGPFLLIILMLYRRTGIMGLKELNFIIPEREKLGETYESQ